MDIVCYDSILLAHILQSAKSYLMCISVSFQNQKRKRELYLFLLPNKRECSTVLITSKRFLDISGTGSYTFMYYWMSI